MCNKQYLLFDTLPERKDLYWLSVIPNAEEPREDKKIAFAKRKNDAETITVPVHFSLSNTASSK